MADAEYILTDPSLVQESLLAALISSLSTSKPLCESVSQVQRAKLVLLQPLADAGMLDACRDPGSRYLNIQPLSKAWRQALMQVPPISQLTFDLTLPKESGKSEGSLRKVYWDIAMPDEASLGVLTRDVMTLVMTIATGTRMRADGHVRFEVLHGETDGVSPRAMMRLKEQLLVLAETKV